MLPSFILALREGLEAALVIGIVLGVLRKTNRQELNFVVWVGVISAGLLSFLAALGLYWLGAEFTGQGEQLFEGGTLLLAAVILTWLITWMQKQNSAIQKNIEKGIQQSTSSEGGHKALFLLAFLAVIREGVELAIFLLAAQLASSPLQELLGACLGIGLAVLLGWMIFNSSRRLSLKRFFQVSQLCSKAKEFYIGMMAACYMQKGQ